MIQIRDHHPDRSSLPLSLSTLARKARVLAPDASGATAITFSLTLMPMFAMIAMAIDYNTNITQNLRVQNALDNAVLAGSVSASVTTTAEQRIAAAQSAFNISIGRDRSTVTSVSFSVDPQTNKVSGVARTERPSTFSQRMLGSYKAQITAAALPTAKQVRALDVVMCVDATGSMYNTLSAVQNNITNFKSNLDAAITAQGYRPFDRTRLRVIYYRDFGGNGYLNLSGGVCSGPYYNRTCTPVTGTSLGENPALVPSSFYDMSQSTQVSQFQTFVNGQSASGGGDLPESGLECLDAAMKSSWTQVGATLANGATVTDVFPIVSIYTDAGAHPPNFANSVNNPTYPSSMPRSYDALRAVWDSATTINQSNKSILFFGNPNVDDDYYYNLDSGWTVVKNWPKFSNPATLTSANNSFITSLARGILGIGNIRLTD